MAGESGAPAIPHCRSLSLLGERAAATLYAADSDRYGGAVTVTVYARPADDRARQRFEAAVETARLLGSHPNIVALHASGHTEDDGRPYVVSDGHERTTMEGVLATSGVLGIDAVLPMGVALAGALETAHRAGVIHGGVAPNVILLRSDGQPVVTEVGLSEFGQPQGASAALARWIPYHAPPEVLEGTDVSSATDVYSLASVLYTLLMGQPPHPGTGVDDSTASLLLRILQTPMPAIERSDVPPGLEDTLRSALSHSPAKRPQHALELAWALQEAQRLAGLEVTEPVVLDPGAGPAAGAGGAMDTTGAGALGAPGPGSAAGAGGAATVGPSADEPPRPDWSWLAPPVEPGAAGPAGPGSPSTPAIPSVPSVWQPGVPPERPAPPADPPASERPPLPQRRPGGPGVPGRPGVHAAGANGLSGAGSLPSPLPSEGAPPSAPSGFAPPSNGTGSGLPGGAGDDPGSPTPWWAVPVSVDDGTPASLSSPPISSVPDGVDLGPLGRPAIDPAVLADALARHDEPPGRSDPMPDSALHQPLPSDERPPLDTSKLAEAFEPGRAAPTGPAPASPPPAGPTPGWPGADRDQGDAPAIPEARQTPTSPGWSPSTGAPGGGYGEGQPDLPGRVERAGASEPVEAGSRRARRRESRDRRGPSGDQPTQDAGFGESGQGAGTNERAVSALERARQARLERQRREREAAGSVSTAEVPPGGSSRRPIGATPDMATARTGPPALPVIVLVVVVVVLGLGGAWMVISGEDGPEPASETPDGAAGDEPDESRTSSSTTSGSTTSTQAAFSPNRASDLTAVETEDGVQLDWEGPVGLTYLIRILSPAEPPRPLFAGPATAELIPHDMVEPGGAYCFDIVAAPDEGAPPISVPSDPNEVVFPTACVGGAEPESVVRP